MGVTVADCNAAVNHQTAKAVAELFKGHPAALARPPAGEVSDRERARRLVAVALSLDGRKQARARAEEVVPGGMLKMEMRRQNEAERAAVACAVWAAGAGELNWSVKRTSDAFGMPFEDVQRMLAAVSEASCRSGPSELKRGLQNLRIAASPTSRG